jgi:hypothetical protein
MNKYSSLFESIVNMRRRCSSEVKVDKINENKLEDPGFDTQPVGNFKKVLLLLPQGSQLVGLSVPSILL